MENEQSRRSYERQLISESELRDAMKQFVDTLDMTGLMSLVIERMLAFYPSHAAMFVESAPTDLHHVKLSMYQIARDMDLTLELSLSLRLKSFLQAREELRLHLNNCNSHIFNGLHLHLPLALETHDLVSNSSPLLQPFRSELTQIVLQRLRNATEIFLLDLIRERFAALEAQLLFTESKIFDFVLCPQQLAAQNAERHLLWAHFVENAELKQPQMLRLININASCCCGKVVLEDFQGENYTAISHTYGLDVYEVFNCECACLCLTQVPRCSSQVCQHDSAVGDESVAKRYRRVVEDILDMCRILQDAGVEFAWHDGVCIAQHDKREVEETIKCMGWIYAKATETIVFLHYVGKPMAPISNNPEQLTCGWHTRVWTVQEMVLSRSRRYCVRVGDSSLRGCNNLREFEERVGRIWNRVEVITEERFIVMVAEICAVLNPLLHNFAEALTGEDTKMYEKAQKWMGCMKLLSLCLQKLALGFPARFMDVLRLCSFRDSKHEGDRMNSVLALAGLKDFVAPKDEDVEEWTIKFFRMQGQQGMAAALFSINAFTPWMKVIEDRRHTWAPSLSQKFVDTGEGSWQDWNELEWTVAEESGGNLELTGGPLVCVALRFTLTQAIKESNRSASEGDPLPVALDENSPVIDMELTRIEGFGNYSCSFAQAPHLVIGCASLQIVVSIPCPYPAVDEGLRGIQEGESFEAHLVLPLHTITMPVQQHSAKPFSSHTPPSLSTLAESNVVSIGDPLGLIVQGELPLVSKIGRFSTTNSLLLQLRPMLESASVTKLHHLVIK